MLQPFYGESCPPSRAGGELGPPPRLKPAGWQGSALGESRSSGPTTLLSPMIKDVIIAEFDR
jgi:hypothetical protein